MKVVFETDKLDDFLEVKKALKDKAVRLRDFKTIGKKMLIEVSNQDQERAVAITKRTIKNIRTCQT